ncbi:MAG: hypothetical protein ACYCOU_14820 [Sulfobacillus sp.]
MFDAEKFEARLREYVLEILREFGLIHTPEKSDNPTPDAVKPDVGELEK